LGEGKHDQHGDQSERKPPRPRDANI